VNLFWDSCVFNAFLYEESDSYDIESIDQYIDEAKSGRFKIYTSSIIFAEIAGSKNKEKWCRWRNGFYERPCWGMHCNRRFR